MANRMDAICQAKRRKINMGACRSSKTHEGKRAPASRALWRATGMTDEDFGKPIIAVMNSFVEFAPSQVHLKDLGQIVAREIEHAGGIAKKFNAITVGETPRPAPCATSILWAANV
jgi:dihydroxy-acid dehydratase